MQTQLQRNFSQNPISVATYCPFIDWHSSGGNTIATLKDACVSTKHQTSAPLAFLVTLTATQRDSRTITRNRGSTFLSHFSCPGREWGLHPWMAYYYSMTDIVQYIYISFINPRVWYWSTSPHFILLVRSICCRLYSMASICCSAPSACHPSTSHLQTARTLRSALVTTGQRRNKTQFPTGTTNYSILRCTNRLWGSSIHLANG